MSCTVFTHRLVAILNKDIELGVAINAANHAAIAMGTRIGAQALHLENYQDANGNIYPISGMPFIILKAKSQEIKKILAEARALKNNQENNQKIESIAFLDTMTGGDYLEQMERTAQQPEENLKFYAAVLYGPEELIRKLTKRLSLYK